MSDDDASEGREQSSAAAETTGDDKGSPEHEIDLIANPFQVDTAGRENTRARDSPARVAVGAKTIPERQEVVRGRLAQWLVMATILLVGFLTLALAANWLNSDELKTAAAVVLSPLVALAGTAAGFYFGGKGAT
ncbi:MAG TPA: hypothetical protein VGN25_10485 [Solirubrobacteraceae bacterium]|jgi:hypothetical protein|nr:hypothetical protein [Solirubrobacteraceae bacterium]